jgi:eukaryotic-like serine/threonine-protein kinase
VKLRHLVRELAEVALDFSPGRSASFPPDASSLAASPASYRSCARRAAAIALSLGKDRDPQYGAAVALALSGDRPRAEAIAAQLDKNYPDDTFVKYLFLPTIRGAVSLRAKDVNQAIKYRGDASAYDLGVEAGLLLTSGVCRISVLGTGESSR